MEIISSMAGWEFLLRYMHFLAGVCWIGVLWYFNFIQTPFFGTELGGQAKSAVTRGLVPNAWDPDRDLALHALQALRRLDGWAAIKSLAAKAGLDIDSFMAVIRASSGGMFSPLADMAMCA